MSTRYYTHPAKNHRPVVHDPQRHTVYRMERDIIGWCINTIVDIDALEWVTQHACRKYKVSIPNINIVNKPNVYNFGWADHEITLNAGFHGQNLGVLLHELAHWIIGETQPDITKHHGVEFIQIYAELMEQYKMMPKDVFYFLCDKYNVEYK